MSDPVSQCHLPAIGILENLPADQCNMLASYGHFRFAGSGETVIREGSPQNSLYLVLSGALHVKRQQAGREILVAHVRTGECFGEVNVFDPSAASATVAAVEPTQLWHIDRDELEAFFAGYPEAAAALLISVASLLSARLRSANAKLVERIETDTIIAEIGGTI